MSGWCAAQKGDPSRAFQTPKRSKGGPLRLAARWTARHYAIGGFAKVREDGLA
jgi:hypothetical protein